MPICLESLDFAADMPSRRFQEKPPLFIGLVLILVIWQVFRPVFLQERNN